MGRWRALRQKQCLARRWSKRDLLTLFGVEHFSAHQGRVSLDFLPYSHSVTSAILLAVVVAAALRTALPRRDLALAAGLAIFSHVVLDVAQHQPDILLLPASVGPRLGTGLLDRPLLNLAVELAYGVACWWIYRYLDVRSASGKAAGGSVTGLNGSCSETQGVHGTTLAIVDRNGEPAGLLHGLSIRRSF